MTGARGTEHHGLDRRLMFLYGLLFSAVVLALLLLSWGRLSALGAANENRLATALGRTLAESVHRVSFSGKYHAALLLDDYIEANPELAYIVIEKFDGTVYAEAVRKGIDPEEFHGAGEHVLQRAREGGTLSQHLELAGLPILEISTPFIEGYQGDRIGVLRVGLDRSGARSSTLEGLAVLVGFGLLIALLGALMLRYLSRKIAAPVHELASTFEAVLEHAPMLISVQDRDGVVVRTSKWRKGQSSSDLELGAAESDGSHGLLCADEWRDENEAILEGEHSIFNETRTLVVDGLPRSYAVTRFPLYSSEGDQVEHICSLAIDITEKLELETHLEQARRMDTIGQFAGGVAHDFNNILMAIMGSAELLRRSPGNQGVVTALATEIIASGNSAAELTGRLLSFGRRQLMRTVDLDLSKALEEFETFLKRILRENVGFYLDIAGGEHWVHADRGQLEQVLMNLVANARDAMPNGGDIHLAVKTVEFEVRTVVAGVDVSPGRYVELEVRDTGTGISPELMSRVFDPFTTTKELGQGTGLGLSIVHSIVEQHGGKITLESEIGHGCCFRIYLPELAESGFVPAPDTTHDEASGLHVLLVDDNDGVRLFVSSALEYLGHTFSVAVDGVEALEQLQETSVPYDLVLADVVMPRMGGDELYRRALKLGMNLPFLFMTGHDRAALASLQADPGGRKVNVIEKPFPIEALGAAIAKAHTKDCGSSVAP